MKQRFIEAAKAVALTSKGVGGKYGFRLGSVIVDKNRIVAARPNICRTHPALVPFFTYPYLHSEAYAILSLGLANCYGRTMYVVRILRDNSFALAKPCYACKRLIAEVGIKQVYYSTNKGVQQL